MFYFNFVLFLDVKSRLEGRMYEVRLPDGSFITVDPLLTQVKIIAKKSQIGKTLGLCQDADRACQSGECLIRTWRYVHFFIYLFIYFLKMGITYSVPNISRKFLTLLYLFLRQIGMM